MLEKVLRFCEQVAGYHGPGHVEAVELVGKLYPDVEPGALKRAFELGYKRGYADAAEYIAEWIEEEED